MENEAIQKEEELVQRYQIIIAMAFSFLNNIRNKIHHFIYYYF